VVAVPVVLALIFFRPGGDTPSSATATATSAPIIAEATHPANTPTPSPAIATEVPTPSPNPDLACAKACLIRLPEPAGGDELGLMERGLRPSFARGGWLWAVASPDLINELAANETPITMIDQSDETLPLYLIQVPSDASSDAEDLVAATGEVVDEVDGEFLVRSDNLTPQINDLVAMGLTIEKLPPPQSARPESMGREILEGPGLLVDSVSTEELTRTITDMEGMGTRAFRSDENAKAADYIARRMIEIGLTVRYQDFVAWDGTYAINVIGELPGTDSSKTFLVLGHYDTINTAGGTAAPGADDNASGIAAMLEVARALAGYRLPYSVQFLATTGEEEAMQGAIAFADEIAKTGKTYTWAINIDSLGWTGRANGLVINGDAATADLEDLLVSINDVFGLGEELAVRQNPKIVADDNVLRDAGIRTVLIARALFGENPVHHTAEDMIEHVDIVAVKSAAELVLLTIGELETR
jgi:Peptidase family M28